jgi:DNA topoisomerase-1
MEKEKIGTKATRAEIISTLYKRNYITNSVNISKQNQNIFNQQKERVSGSSDNISYTAVSHSPSSIDFPSFPHFSYSFPAATTTANATIPEDSNYSKNHNKTKDTFSVSYHGTGIKPTDLGIAVINLLRKYIPNIVSTEMTRSMEQHLEQIEIGLTPSKIVINNAKEEIKRNIIFFEQNEKEIGNKISKTLIEAPKEKNFSSKITILGSCPVCRNGNLIIKKSIKTKKRFVGCSLFSINKCNATAPLPQNGTIKSISKLCEACKWPIVSGTKYNQKKRHQLRFCINTQCPSKNKIEGKIDLNNDQN